MKNHQRAHHVKKAINELQKIHLHLSSYHFKILNDYADLIYGIGFDDGYKEGHAHKGMLVGKYSDNDLLIEVYPSLSEAARKMKTPGSNIHRAIHEKIKAKGFYWKFIR